MPPCSATRTSRASRSLWPRFVLPAVLCLTAAARGQSYDAARFQPVTSSNSGAKALVTNVGARVDLVNGTFVEVELPVDELGRRVAVTGIGVRFDCCSSGEIAISGRAVPNGPLSALGVFPFESIGNLEFFLLSAPTRLAAVRIAHHRNISTQTPVIEQLQIYASDSSRTIEVTGHSWFLQQPSSGSLASIGLQVLPRSQDNFGLLFASVGTPLASTPILQMPTAQGGLLLDPVSLSLVDARPLIGTSAWPFVVTFPYDPAILSASIHLQALLGDAFTNPRQPLLFWTRPITIHS